MAASRKLYVAMAEKMAENERLAPTADIRCVLALVVLDISDAFKADNGNFKKDKFVRACGFPELADN